MPGIVQDDPEPDRLTVRAGRTVSRIANEGCLDDHFEPSLPRLSHLEKDVVFDDIAVFSDQMSLATQLGPLRRFVLAHPLGR